MSEPRNKERKRLYDLEYAAKHREKRRAYNREYAREHRSKYNEYMRAWFVANPDKAEIYKERQNARRRARELQMRLEVLHGYGAMCACCGELRLEFLSIDHVNGGGNTERKVLRNRYSQFKLIIASGFPPEYQILCHNCNQAKGYYGVCPHQIERQNAVA